jgi:hypothetical protein
VKRLSALGTYPSVKAAQVKGTSSCCGQSGVVNVTNSYGDTEAIHLDLADLTTGEVQLGVVMYPKMIISGLRDRVGAPPVLATVEQRKASTGQSPPWLLKDQSRVPSAVATANKFADTCPDFFTAGPTAHSSGEPGDAELAEDTPAPF